MYNDTQGQQVTCGSHDPIVYNSAIITCGSNSVGRYVHFKRYGGFKLHTTALCEMVIIGHKYIGM